MAHDYKQYTILYVDDEETSLKYFSKLLENKFTIVTFPTAEQAWEYIQAHAHDIAVLFTDQRMPGMKGVDLLEKVCTQFPQIIRILVTAYSDMESAIDSVNRGEIYRYVTKPWDIAELDVTLSRALEHFLVDKERNQLLRFKLDAVFSTMLCDRILSLSLLCHLPSFVEKRFVGAAYRSFLHLFDLEKLSPHMLPTSPDASSAWQELLQGQKDFFIMVNARLETWLHQWQIEGLSLAKEDARLLEQVGEGILESSFMRTAAQRDHLIKLLVRLVRCVEGPGGVTLAIADNAVSIQVPSVFALQTAVTSLFDRHDLTFPDQAVELLAIFLLLYHYGYIVDLHPNLSSAPWIISPREDLSLAAEQESLIDSLVADKTFWDRIFP